jgi:hypothetical protein
MSYILDMLMLDNLFITCDSTVTLICNVLVMFMIYP